MKRWNIDMRVGTRFVRRVYMFGSLMRVLRALSWYVKFNGNARGQMRGQWHHTRRSIDVSLWKEE
jgi:hypothetical protein